MLFKVFYQENVEEVPVREETKTLFLEAENVQEVRKKLADNGFNIEFIREVSGKYLEYEQQSENFKVENA